MGRRLLDDAAVADALAGLQWDRDGDELVRTVVLDDFAGAMVFVNRVAELAEERDHHPDIAISWNRVTLRVTTHDSGGLTAADVDLARAVDAIAPG
ncbi:MAG TPA: 4a-hydroxytetrahydrobiopterin dehydratase [Acidimicrobiales bacterium]|nr:4a-hydroxytetrahydrobiopterin dehydratase [Acidimicrobiales bacterium]